MITSIEIKAVEPLADGAAFGNAGAYERVIGVAKGEVDPKAPGNAGIALIDKAPLNARGRVEYTTDFFILRPKDFAKGNGHILYEVNNRGRKMLFGNICDGPQGMNDPKTAADVGNGFPLRQGWTIVWSGWDPDAPRANMGLGLTAPVATQTTASRSCRRCARNGSRARAWAHWKRSSSATRRPASTRPGRSSPCASAPTMRRPRCRPATGRSSTAARSSSRTSRSRASSMNSTTRARTRRCRAWALPRHATS